MKHSKFEYIKAFVADGEAVLLEGEAGTGKTTIAMDVAKALKLEFHAMSMTKQTTVNSIIGFISINGNYIGTEFRKAFESGGLFLLDEIDAADPNTILCLNTIENGFMSFPDGVVHKHQDFRLIATANPQDQHNTYTGRSKLDASTLDRFEPILVERDENLEVELTSQDTCDEIGIARSVLIDNNITKPISMRDAIRYHKRKVRGLDETPIQKLLKEDNEFMNSYTSRLLTLRPPPPPLQSELNTADDIWKSITKDADVVGKTKERTGKPF